MKELNPIENSIQFANSLRQANLAAEADRILDCLQTAGSSLELHLMIRLKLRKFAERSEVPPFLAKRASQLVLQLTDAIGSDSF